MSYNTVFQKKRKKSKKSTLGQNEKAVVRNLIFVEENNYHLA